MLLVFLIFVALPVCVLFEELWRHRSNEQAAAIYGLFWVLCWTWVLIGLVGLCTWLLFGIGASYILFGRDGMTAVSIVAAISWIIIWILVAWLGVLLRNGLLRLRGVASSDLKAKPESEEFQRA
jgi:O-antigen/teichoic acid export membrane protein